jgi:cardiolipin synthase
MTLLGFEISQVFLLAELFFIANLFLSFLLVFIERRNPVSTWAWLMVLSFLPVVGFIMYMFFGRNLRKQKRFSKKKDKDKIQRQFLNKRDKNKEFNPNDPLVKKFSELIHLHYISAQSAYTNSNEIKIYNEGDAKFNDLISCLEEAKSYIHMEYYIFRPDQIGKKILEVLERKASEGIEVKFLYDGMGTLNLPQITFNKLKKYGGETASFLPFSYIPNLRINYRNHRKIVIVDGQTAFIGGFNIGDEYIGRSVEFGYWRDTHLRISGGAVNSIQRQFLLDWRFAKNDKEEFKKKYFPEKKMKGDSGVQIVSSGPDSVVTSVKYGYFKIINSASDSICIQTPYLIPDESILQALKVASLSGVDVKIMIPAMADHIAVQYASMSYIWELMEAGVKCYLYKRGFLHSKMITADGVIGSVGSANFDMRSFNLNFEINAFIYDPNIIKKLDSDFIQDLLYCKELTVTDYNKRKFYHKALESLARLFSPLL